MSEELRDLHDRIGATTVYVTHDQLEAMSMADRIAVMNHGVVEQIGAPQEIYDLPASMFVADFVGSPPMNFIPFEGSLNAATGRCGSEPRTSAIPEAREEGSAGRSCSACGPSTCRSPTPAPIRGRVFGAEYLGTTQIVTVDIDAGPDQGAPALDPAGAARRDGRARLQVGVAHRLRRDDRPGAAQRACTRARGHV